MNAPRNPGDPSADRGTPAAPLKPGRTLLAMGALITLVSVGVLKFQDWGEQKVAAELSARARPGDIRMISSESCVYCSQARSWLTTQRIPFSECFIERDADCAAQYQALGAKGTPTLLVRGHPQVGFNPQRISAALASR